MKKIFLRNKSIKFTITISIIAMLVISNISVLIFSNFFARRYFSNQIKEDMAKITQLAGEKIDEQLNYLQSILIELSKYPILDKDNLKNTDVVKHYEERAKDLNFKVFFYIDKNGIGTNLSVDGEKFDVSKREYFKQSINGKIYISDIVKDMKTGKNIVVISVPHYKDGKISGVLAGIKDIHFISDMCSNFNWKNSGIISVVDKTTKVIGHTNKEVLEKNINIIEESKKKCTV